MKEIMFKNKFGDELYGNSWEVIHPKKIVLIVTGMAEHSGRYNHFASFLNSNDISVYCLDHYGQGKNGELGNPPVDYFFKMIETINEYILYLKKTYGLPVYLFSHSMGSFISQGFIEKHSSTPDKVVLCGTNGRNPLVKLGNLYTKLFVNDKNRNELATTCHNLAIGAYEKTIKNSKSPNEWISYNHENVKRYDKDPLSGFRCTNGFYKEFMKGLASIQKTSSIKGINKKLPIYIVGGQDDAVSNMGKGLKSLYKLYKKHGLNVKLSIYEGMRHEILNEEDNVKPYQDILNFFNE